MTARRRPQYVAEYVAAMAYGLDMKPETLWRTVLKPEVTRILLETPADEMAQLARSSAVRLVRQGRAR